MSRIGKQPVSLPGGVEASFSSGALTVKGPKGELTQGVDSAISVEVDGEKKEVRFSRNTDMPTHRALHGLYRALCQNMVVGVTQGYSRRLEVHGVGYQSVLQGDKLSLSLGFSNNIVLPVPKGLTVNCPNNTTIDVTGIDKQLVGQFAARIRGSRPSEPYKGKGVRYAGEQIRRKAGKSMAGGG